MLQDRSGLTGAGSAAPFTIFRGAIGQFVYGFFGALIALQYTFAQDPVGGVLLKPGIGRDCRSFLGGFNAFAHRFAIIMARNFSKLGEVSWRLGTLRPITLPARPRSSICS
jgi:hypothetical protein